VASKKGGVDIETVAKEEPEAIFVQTIDPVKGLTEADLDKVIKNLDL